MMVTLNLRRQAAEQQLILTGVDSLNKFDRGTAIETWRGRMVNEHISARVFASLIPQMMKAGLDASHLSQVAVMITDELRHGRQCAAVVSALGGDPCAEIPELADVPNHEDASPLEGLLRNVLSISCLSETVAVALIRAEQQAVAPPEMHTTLSMILADEVQHARFGWGLLREVSSSLDKDVKNRLSDYLVVAFAHLREHELKHLPIDHIPSSAASEVGVCDGRDARTLFFDTVHQVIIPGLEKHGFAAKSAWQDSMNVGMHH
ncbi:MAG: ferritin-like domain-containing protein [Myxococcales bacterium]|nr:ferritin-like domain-containing protein [Myxococcales bacterium]